ncbi:iron superoxide dismutase [Reticulomyxa filosa]|uniref:superoxide dismutase n=1 Tax=Reticulomyxa filosa TaxID=46433 RepID=X6N246_RETFI|nr:iron superoxide dismutase [Reticulomyxa filosa]|eukprot:ETO20340.1 iron superoxide dismutase [Reticulomyxa filosa]
MSAEGGGKPSGKLGDQIAKDFGSFEKFKEQFTASATNHFGSGWVWLSWDDKKGVLVITEGHDAQNPLKNHLKPILTIDVWEHAYYIDYKNDRPAYINAWWNCVDWKVVEKRLEYFCQLTNFEGFFSRFRCLEYNSFVGYFLLTSFSKHGFAFFAC